MDRNHRRDRITINEEGNLVPETSFFRTLQKTHTTYD
jgi:hypothetical protein